MLEARNGERSSIARGIVSRQKAIASPKATAGTPASRRCATADRPCGPAPMTTTGEVGETRGDVSVSIDDSGRSIPVLNGHNKPKDAERGQR